MRDLKEAERSGKRVATLDYRQDHHVWWRCNPSESFITAVEKVAAALGAVPSWRWAARRRSWRCAPCSLLLGMATVPNMPPLGPMMNVTRAGSGGGVGADVGGGVAVGGDEAPAEAANHAAASTASCRPARRCRRWW